MRIADPEFQYLIEQVWKSYTGSHQAMTKAIATGDAGIVASVPGVSADLQYRLRQVARRMCLVNSTQRSERERSNQA